jgi:mono/diheme cytochrome c family protein
MLRTRILLFVAAGCLTAGAYADSHESGNAEKGKALFQEKCGVCHLDDSKDKKIGPGLAGIKDGTLPSGKEATRENVIENLNTGGNGMPPFKELLSDEERTDIVAYVLSL